MELVKIVKITPDLFLLLSVHLLTPPWDYSPTFHLFLLGNHPHYLPKLSPQHQKIMSRNADLTLVLNMKSQNLMELVKLVQKIKKLVRIKNLVSALAKLLKC